MTYIKMNETSLAPFFIDVDMARWALRQDGS